MSVRRISECPDIPEGLLLLPLYVKKERKRRVHFCETVAVDLDSLFGLRACHPLLIRTLCQIFGKLCDLFHTSLPIPSPAIIFGDIGINVVTHSKT